MQAIGVNKLFTGEQWLEDVVVEMVGGIVKVIGPRKVYDRTIHREAAIAVPAFIDLQVYGAGGRLFSAYPHADTLRLMADRFLQQGTALCFPTLATNSIEVFKQCIDATREYWSEGGRGIGGLHLEGPWINEKKRGAHLSRFIHRPTLDEVKELVAYGEGVIRIITLAPECCGAEIIAFLSSKDILVSAGHSDASFEEANESFDSGVKAVTHLYNAMSALQHRSPGLVGASFLHKSVMASIIPDGIHVSFDALKIAKRIIGSRLFAITDAVTDTDRGPYQHKSAGDWYEAAGVLSGSALSMHKAFKNLVEHGGLDVDEALRMCSTYPAQVSGCDQHGRISPGAAAVLLLNSQWEVVECITA